jgi:hypothetical protein
MGYSCSFIWFLAMAPEERSMYHDCNLAGCADGFDNVFLEALSARMPGMHFFLLFRLLYTEIPVCLLLPFIRLPSIYGVCHAQILSGAS